MALAGCPPPPRPCLRAGAVPPWRAGAPPGACWRAPRGQRRRGGGAGGARVWGGRARVYVGSGRPWVRGGLRWQMGVHTGGGALGVSPEVVGGVCAWGTRVGLHARKRREAGGVGVQADVAVGAVTRWGWGAVGVGSDLGTRLGL